MRQGGLHAGNQRLAVEQKRMVMAIERALSPLLQASWQIGIEIGGRRDAAGEGAGACIEQHRFGGGKYIEALETPRVAGVVHVAG